MNCDQLFLYRLALAIVVAFTKFSRISHIIPRAFRSFVSLQRRSRIFERSEIPTDNFALQLSWFYFRIVITVYEFPEYTFLKQTRSVVVSILDAKNLQTSLGTLNLSKANISPFQNKLNENSKSLSIAEQQRPARHNSRLVRACARLHPGHRVPPRVLVIAIKQ